ncbi:unnamed protein product [Pylaiella littoralis]
MGRRALLGRLSSKQGCWLPAMLVDGYPEVKAAALAALSLDPLAAHGGDDKVAKINRRPSITSLSSSSCPDTPPPAAAATAEPAACSTAVAVMRGACKVLRAAARTVPPPGREDDGAADPRYVDLAEEEAARTALRALRGVSSLRLPQQRLQQQQQEDGEDEEEEEVEEEESTHARVEALEIIETWLAGTLPGPPGVASVPWPEEEGAQVAAASLAGVAPGGSLSCEAQGAVRALLSGQAQGGVFRATAVGAAAAAVEAFRSECLLGLTVGNGGRESEDGGEENDLWRRVYCALLVRLEVLFTSGAGSAESASSSSASASLSSPTAGRPVRRAVDARGNARDVTRSSSPFAAADQSDEGTGSGDDNTPVATAAAVEPSSFLPLAKMLAEALEDVPFAHEQAIPPNLDHEGDDTPVREKKALRARGSRRRGWIVSSTHLLLRAGTRFCERCRRRSIGDAPAAAAVGGEGQQERSAATTTTTVQAATRADNPTEAWLSCVRPGDSLANRGTTAATTAAEARELGTPIPWESCLHGQALPRHELPAPWASSPATVKLGKDLVNAAWSALSLDDGGGDGGNLAAERSAEALVRALRAAPRARGGWRDEAGVGIKHAISAIRRLRFPLVAGVTLGHALPLALPLADDHDPAHQAVGLSLLLHLGAEASPAELARHRGILLEVIERGIRGGGRDPSASVLCLALAVGLLRRAPGDDGSSNSSSSSSSNGAGRAGIRIAREAIAQAARATDGEVRKVMVCGAAALLELPATREGYASCEFLRPALLCLLPILQSSPVSTRLDARAASLRAVHTLCLSCWPRVHAHASKLLCSLLWTCADCARRASVRRGSSSSRGGAGGNGDGDDTYDGAPPLGVELAANHAAIDAETDRAVRAHATRLGALVLLLAGGNGGGGGGGGERTTSSARATLREVCAAVATLRPAGAAMEQLADRTFLLERERGREESVATP